MSAKPKRVDLTLRRYVADTVGLRETLRGQRKLSDTDRVRIVEQALRLLEENYSHLRMKEAMYAVDPIGRLKVLLRTLLHADRRDKPNQDEFHREMFDIFFSLRDRHTVYSRSDLAGKVAFLPFLVEEIKEEGRFKYIVSNVLPNTADPRFVPGSELIEWNGVPIERAISNNALRQPGGTPDARRAMGVARLTVRPLQYGPAPDEEWVVADSQTPDGTRLWEKFSWVVGPDPWKSGSAEGDEIDDVLSIIRRLHLAVFARPTPAGPVPVDRAIPQTFDEVPTAWPRIFRARHYPRTGRRREFGYIRIWRFNRIGPQNFVEEFVRLLRKLPRDGLIIDIRANPGGKIVAAERILQTLTPKHIDPEPFEFRNTPLNLKICKGALPQEGLKPWCDSIEQGLRTGAIYSAGFPKSTVQECNAIGQKYRGPVVLITDALSYSAADIFAAGFQDHDIGPVLGVHRTTGAGGANRWTFDDLREWPFPEYDDKLPEEVSFTLAMRRSLRVGRRAGSVLEDFGVEADAVHDMTWDDVMNDNVDLINKAASMFRGRGARRNR